MLQVIQSYKTGELRVLQVPAPICREGGVLVRTTASLISAGTEKSGLKLARKNLLGKAASRPDLVKKVWEKVRTEGYMEAYRQAMGRLDSPVPLGYSSAGEVIEVGAEVAGFRIGDRVACFGSPWAAHAEVDYVPKNLSVKVPAGVSDEEAAFAGVGAIALHGIRLLNIGLGDTVVVIGLGLMGLISVQLIKASGGRVIGYDPDQWKCELARELGADGAFGSEEKTRSLVAGLTGGAGADAVIVMAATKSPRPVELAAELAREKALIAVPGLVGLSIPRPLFYEKELRLVIPHSAGPGIDDINYEERGKDYPLPYARWSGQRNLAAFLSLVGEKKVILDKLITHYFPIEKAEQAYQLIGGTSGEKYIGVLLTYPREKKTLERKVVLSPIRTSSGPLRSSVGVGLIGAGLFAKGTLLPAIKGISWIRLKGIATATGSSGHHTGEKFGFEYCTTDYREILNDSEIDCVLIATRHNLHASLVVESLEKGKDVFVEKPLALDMEELNAIISAYEKSSGGLLVGHNRRFSPFSRQVREWLSGISGPLVINCRVNAGYVPPESWVQNRAEGGGRIIGEVGHFIDLIQHLSGSLPARVYADSIVSDTSPGKGSDNLIITLRMKNGSVASITYAADGDKSFPRERVEVFGGDSVCLIDNFRSASFFSSGRTRKKKMMNVDRGHKAEFRAFFEAVKKNRDFPVDFSEYIYTTVTTFKIEESLRRGVPLEIEIDKSPAPATV
ncbi:MAG: bi-domain-containing oxidoreductase [Candidatus Auribacterota bacterium]|nr:bi-domain-containing oxidoreductase [Candidatus Auribacterota bacterium]